jgi:hypothetical protein
MPTRQQGDNQAFQELILTDDYHLYFIQNPFYWIPILEAHILIHRSSPYLIR